MRLSALRGQAHFSWPDQGIAAAFQKESPPNRHSPPFEIMHGPVGGIFQGLAMGGSS
jgi:hypothetical protein